MNELILIVDDDRIFIEELRKQAQASEQWRERCLVLCFGEEGFWEQITLNRPHIIAAFLDYDLLNDERGSVVDFMRGSLDYLNWNSIRVFWFSGDDNLSESLIEQKRQEFPGLETKHLRKPFTLKDIFAHLEKGFELAPQWKNFSSPLRVLNREGVVCYNNTHWKNAVNQPDPDLFIKQCENAKKARNAQDVFKTGALDFYERPPNGKTDACDFRLHSFIDDSGNYLIQYPEILGLSKGNDWKTLVDKIAEALRGHGYTRIRFYRYYNVPYCYDKDDSTNMEYKERGVLDLCYSNTELNSGISVGIQTTPLRKQLSGGLLIRIEECKKKFQKLTENRQSLFNAEDGEEELFFYIDSPDSRDKTDSQGWDEIIVPPDAKGYSIVELPLFSPRKGIQEITNSQLIGKLAFDKFDTENNCFQDIPQVDIKPKLEKTLLSYCKALAKSLADDIVDTHRETLARYVEMNKDKDMPSPLDKPKEFLEELLKRAIIDVESDVGYLTERHPQGYQITVASSEHQLFKSCVFSEHATDLTVVRCWQDQKMKALPDTASSEAIMEKIRSAYQTESLVWNDTNPAWDRQACIQYLCQNIASLIALPVFAGKEIIAAIILHSTRPNHFDHEKLDKLRNLTARVGWMLMVSRQERLLQLDGIVHEIKSDVVPLKKALESLRSQDHQLPAWRRSLYCATRLDMAVRSMLLMNRGIPDGEQVKPSALIEVLRNLIESYQPDMEDRGQTFVIDPPLPESTEAKPTDAVWFTQVPMGLEWLTHIVANLLDNAVKYSKRGEIRIRGVRKTTQVELTIENPGILSQEQARLAFEPSYRSEQGTGFHVGLASCKLVMKKHGGEITLTPSTNGASNRVIATVRWPLSC